MLSLHPMPIAAFCPFLNKVGSSMKNRGRFWETSRMAEERVTEHFLDSRHLIGGCGPQNKVPFWAAANRTGLWVVNLSKLGRFFKCNDQTNEPVSTETCSFGPVFSINWLIYLTTAFLKNRPQVSIFGVKCHLSPTL